jgi:hypothetical protein
MKIWFNARVLLVALVADALQCWALGELDFK